jgi:hypothetical protein
MAVIVAVGISCTQPLPRFNVLLCPTLPITEYRQEDENQSWRI